MKKLWISSICLMGSVAIQAQTFGVVPNAYESTAGTGGFLFMVTTARTYQYVIDAGQLTSFVGKNLTGMQWRLLAAATSTWPPTDISFSSFDIYMGAGVAPAAQSTTFANNFLSTPVRVRSGALTIAGGSFPVSGSPHDFGPTVSFSPYLYTGGNLTVEMRHTGFTGSTSTASFDALISTTAGYGTSFSSQWTGSYDGLTGGTANFFVTRFTAAPVPEPASIAAFSLGLAAIARRKRKSLTS